MDNLSAAISQLEAEWKALTLCWEETQKVWIDLVRHEFEREYWDALAPHPPAVQREMERLVQVIAGAKRSVK
jgi:hypothetical protein